MKDPAILLYTSDFLTGTMLMTDEQVGKYIRLLCLQHQTGRLSEKHMLGICKARDEDIYEKFVLDHNGFYYNVRLEEEILKRAKYRKGRSDNAKGGKTPTKKPIKAYAQHMEDEDVNENEDKKGNKKRTVRYPFTTKSFSDAWELWKEYKIEQHKFKYTPIGEQAKLNGLTKLADGYEQNAIDIINYSMGQGYKGLFKEPINNNKNGTHQEQTVDAVKNLINKVDQDS